MPNPYYSGIKLFLQVWCVQPRTLDSSPQFVDGSARRSRKSMSAHSIRHPRQRPERAGRGANCIGTPTPRHLQFGVLGALTAVVLVSARHHNKNAAEKVGMASAGADRQRIVVQAAHRLNRASGLIATSTLLDSAMEHERGSFHNKAMITPLIMSAATIAVSAHGTADARTAAHGVRDAVYGGAALTGLVGTGFHIHNIAKRPGGFRWQNLFYGAPLGAPAAVGLAGLLGYYSERLRQSKAARPRVFGLRAGRALAGLSAVGMLASAAEAGLLHLRGAFHDPFMFVPVTVPPVAAGLLAKTAVNHPRPVRAFTRWWLRLTAVVGVAGAGFHALGVHRNMSGWRNWRQNLFNGPPIPAPPSFTGLALAGLASLALLGEHPDA